MRNSAVHAGRSCQHAIGVPGIRTTMLGPTHTYVCVDTTSQGFLYLVKPTLFLKTHSSPKPHTLALQSLQSEIIYKPFNATARANQAEQYQPYHDILLSAHQKKKKYTHSLTHSLTFALTHSLTRICTHTHSITHSHLHSHSLTHSLAFTLSLTHSLAFALTLTHSHLHSPTHIRTHSHLHSHSLTHSLTNSLTRIYTHSRTHICTH